MRKKPTTETRRHGGNPRRRYMIHATAKSGRWTRDCVSVVADVRAHSQKLAIELFKSKFPDTIVHMCRPDRGEISAQLWARILSDPRAIEATTELLESCKVDLGALFKRKRAARLEPSSRAATGAVDMRPQSKPMSGGLE